jgi:hypothetical protein
LLHGKILAQARLVHNAFALTKNIDSRHLEEIPLTIGWYEHAIEWHLTLKAVDDYALSKVAGTRLRVLDLGGRP